MIDLNFLQDNLLFMKPTYILKIGGSVATYKNKKTFSIRRTLLKNVAREIFAAKKQKDFNLIIIHGAGGLGHFLAKEYGLKEGTKTDKKKIYGALLSRNANQKLDNAIVEIFVQEGLQAAPVHTASVIVQNNHQIDFFETSLIDEAFANDYIPVLYGDMVFDKKLGMTICSGDAIAPYLANVFSANKIFFASDVDGVFDKDPYLHRDAKLLEFLNFAEIEKSLKKSESHNIDATGGLYGKIKKINLLDKKIESVEIFNGFSAKNYHKILLSKKFKHTKITF